MSDRRYFFDGSQPFDYDDFIEGLAETTSLKKNNRFGLSEAEAEVFKQEIEAVFDLLLESFGIQSNKNQLTTKLNLRPRGSNLWTIFAPTVWMQLSCVGCGFFLIAAIVTAIAHPEAKLPIIIYLTICMCFLILFILMWAFRWIEPFKNLDKETEIDFIKARDESVLIDWQVIDAIVKKANHQPEVLQYVENKLQLELEKYKNSIKMAYKCLRIGIVLVIALLIYNFVPLQALLQTLFVVNVAALSAILALISALAVAIILMLEFILDSRQKFQTIKYKTCLYYLKQAQLLLNS